MKKWHFHTLRRNTLASPLGLHGSSHKIANVRPLYSTNPLHTSALFKHLSSQVHRAVSEKWNQPLFFGSSKVESPTFTWIWHSFQIGPGELRGKPSVAMSTVSPQPVCADPMLHVQQCTCHTEKGRRNRAHRVHAGSPWGWWVTGGCSLVHQSKFLDFHNYTYVFLKKENDFLNGKTILWKGMCKMNNSNNTKSIYPTAHLRFKKLFRICPKIFPYQRKGYK